MQLETLQMDPDLALQRYQEYSQAIRQQHSETEKILAQGYKALSEGQQILDLIQTLKTGGVDAAGRPRLAITRADAKSCIYQSSWSSGGVFYMDTYPTRYRSRMDIQLPTETFPLRKSHIRCKAIVPYIPPNHHPQHKLKNYHILWEADWEDYPIDPVLLRHIGGYLYIVLAQWDLTDLERAVLRQIAS